VRLHLDALERIDAILAGLVRKPGDLTVTTDEWGGKTLDEVVKADGRPEVEGFSMWVTNPYVAVDFKRGDKARVAISDDGNTEAVRAFERMDRVLRENQLDALSRTLRSALVGSSAFALAVTLAMVSVWCFINERVLGGAIAILGALGLAVLSAWVFRARQTRYRVYLIRKSAMPGFWRSSENGPLIGLIGAAVGAVLGSLVTALLS
jgi:hypothetical protein